MSYILKYRSSRREIWKWYWRRWLKGFWFQHLFIALAVSFSVTFSNHLGLAGFFLTLFLTFFLLIAVFSAWPMIAFKHQERTLEVGPTGWSTRIGDKSGSKSWNEVESIDSENGAVVIASRSGNALIVPISAFPDPDAQQKFIQDARIWKANAES